MTNTTEREQIVAWLERQAIFNEGKGADHQAVAHALQTAAIRIERGDHLKEPPHA